MKNILIIVLFVLILCNCSHKETCTVITGSIQGGTVENFTYTIPLNETVFAGFYDTIPIDEHGNFKISLIHKETVFIDLSFKGKPDGYEKPASYNTKLVIEPGKDFELHINLEDSRSPWIVNGKNEKIQIAYMGLPAPSHPFSEVRRFVADGIERLSETINEQKQKELDIFKELLPSGEISQALYNNIELERNYFYALIETMALQSSQTEEPLNPETAHQIEEILTNYPPITEILRTSFGYWYLENYVKNFKVWIKEEYTRDKFQEEVSRDNRHTFFFNKGMDYLPTDLYEYYQATFLLNETYQKNYEAELIPLYKSFKSNFPKSVYISYIDPLVKEIEDYRDMIEKPYKETMIFIEDSIDSFETLTKLFKGKKLYIDVWATWCGPCKEEFKYNVDLKKHLKEQDTEILYISIDEDERATNWKEMIKFFDLEGTHFRPQSKVFREQLYNMFSDGKGYISIPWYILIDEEGNIVEKYAKRPSQLVSQ